MAPKTLDACGLLAGTDKASHHHDFLRVYEPLLERFDPAPDILEFGVLDGASLRAFRLRYPAARLVGVDLQEPPEPLPDDVAFVRGDCTARLPAIDAIEDRAGLPHGFDLVIDDASHRYDAIVEALRHNWFRVRPGGYYVIEDACCLFWPMHGGSPYAAGELLFRLWCVLNAGGQLTPDLARRRAVMPGYEDEGLGLTFADVESVTLRNSLIVIEKAGR